ncbi:hypothetical protein FZEAL_9116 [Fusarium zealandicum]|uniref:Vault poly n=1 Tax=Fusarium zealandicum TaxID=1053134 RepID=A0A8H4UD22_9HYPO|nr:hypothetical protein FZEAL_9116 [Fusarium zealandicum]
MGWGSTYQNCGCFFYSYSEHARKYLPQVQVKAHTTILATTSRTNLTQTFVNPNEQTPVEELRYIFPLYDGVSVVAFTCTVGSRVIKGVVKERQKAKTIYEKAKAQGQTAGLFEQSLESADVFTTTIGNVPAGEKVQVDITYLGELKHDAEVDGVRFTIPTRIVPRYGHAESLSGGSNVFKEQGMSFTIDAEMPDGSSIKSIQSPSHPISVSIGTTSTTTSEEPSLRRASATLQQGATNLDTDFIIQVIATNIGEPSALLETHPTIPNQRALMTTLVPKFKLPAEKPEIVFVCDRSGSMGGNIPDLIAASQLFLKSLPVGVKFNICSFGSHFSFLWGCSRTYSQETLDEAVRHVNSFSNDFGGTEMYQPIEATFKQRYTDMNLEVFLLTDGEIWGQEQLFNLVNETVAESQGAVRVFSLGIGAGASTSLIEGIARAGNGFAQTVANGETMNKKIIRMLKGALYPHITDYSLEIKYEKADGSTDDDEFELVERVVDALEIDTEEAKTDDTDAPKQPISLFDRSNNDDDDTEMTEAPDVEAKYDHLPAIAVPRYLQTPCKLPPLFPFNRSTAYVLLSDATPAREPKSVLLKGTSRQGPLELEIPITTLAEKDSVIHQLAARKEVKELEECRGWLAHAKDSSGELLKEKHRGRFSDLVEREAVRLGVTYQVGGKWCSFVAVEASEIDKAAKPPFVDCCSDTRAVDSRASTYCARSVSGASFPGGRGGLGAPPPPPAPSGGSVYSSGVRSAGLFGQAPSGNAGGLFRNAQPASTFSGGLFGGSQNAFVNTGCLFGGLGSAQTVDPVPVAAPAGEASMSKLDFDILADFDTDSFLDCPPDQDAPFSFTSAFAEPDTRSPLGRLTTLQTFSGSWSWSSELETVLGVTAQQVTQLELPAAVKGHAEKDIILSTMCAVVFFKNKLKSEEDEWEMLVEKAEAWLEEQIGEGVIKELESIIGKLF